MLRTIDQLTDLEANTLYAIAMRKRQDIDLSLVVRRQESSLRIESGKALLHLTYFQPSSIYSTKGNLSIRGRDTYGEAAPLLVIEALDYLQSIGVATRKAELSRKTAPTAP